MSTIHELLRHSGGDAIGAPDREWMSHRQLRELVARTVDDLNGTGIGRGDRVAIVLPNGPEMAAAFHAIASGTTVAPLNPAYREEEFDFYIGDLGARAIVVAEGYAGPALDVARRRGLLVLRLGSDPAGVAGDFALNAGVPSGTAERRGPAEAEDVALILHTSGTTSRPKIVPLLHRNLAASAAHIGRSLALSPDDRCLNIMPLFHIHGLIAATLASLTAGGSVCCTPGFDALRFYHWLDAVRPTWLTGVPTMHQAILARAPRNREVIAGARLRLIRSSSASLPPQVMRRLGETFGCPVIESYGMTEAAHQMTSNPLETVRQKPGSVGVEAGPLVRIADEADGRILATGALGEVVISGPNVTPGYEANPEANAKAFFEVDGRRWFRTGDQGVLDAEGYLRITGRLKEIINRGGEKVSPLEIDEVLMDHPAVLQVVTFAMPHPTLGEEIAAAVVLRDGVAAEEQEIRAFVGKRLAPFKVPRKVVIVDEIPKGATGKLQRIGLAAKLGLAP
jgi:acyl-CoA synthetase (AMP-forming)/AMP-acid ligase II